jgi:hypothetical protein
MRFFSKHIDASLQEGRQSQNRQLGYREVKRRVDRRRNHVYAFIGHILFMFIIFTILDKLELTAVTAMIIVPWILLVFGHFIAVILYIIRWSPKQLEGLAQDSGKSKRIPNERFG